MTGLDLTGIIYALFFAIMLVFAMKYISAIFQAMARAASDKQYRIFAEKTVTVQAESQATLSAIQADLAKLTSTLAAVQKILQQVE